jgi:hypothetical protein
LGQKPTFIGLSAMSALPPITTEKADIDNVGFVPIGDMDRRLLDHLVGAGEQHG